MTDQDKLIWERFRIKHNDTLPFTGWAKVDRDDLAKVFRDLGYRYGAEIGTANGVYAKILCQLVPGLHLLCIDPWQAYHMISQEKCDERYAEARERLLPFNAELIRKPSLEAVKDVPLASLDFVYIDGNHEFDAVMQDIIQWAPRVRPGGMVTGHDYYHFYRSGVIQAVDVYTRVHNIQQWYITKDGEPSWLWVQG